MNLKMWVKMWVFFLGFREGATYTSGKNPQIGDKTMLEKNAQIQSEVEKAKAQEASRAAPAPLIFIAVLLVGVLLSLVFPVSFLPPMVTLLTGAVFFVLPFGLGLMALRAMRRARTSVNPYKPTTVLLTEGPFRVSRNPMYLGMVVQYVGLALLFNSLWAIVLLPLALVIIHLTVIKREERYLELTFGEQYRVYKTKVRRWI
jgi:protein-S-isoprenylcysteine O-methyltransferase Ste14